MLRTAEKQHYRVPLRLFCNNWRYEANIKMFPTKLGAGTASGAIAYASVEFLVVEKYPTIVNLGVCKKTLC
jgi:hypothetical protein